MNYIWVTIEKFGNVGLKVIGLIILARVLAPSDFGLFSIAAIIVSFSNVIVDSGLGGSLIKKNNVTDLDYSTVFVFNLTVSLILVSGIYALSDIISKYFGHVELGILIELMSLLIIFKSLYLIQITKLTRELNFKIQAKISLVAYVISFPVGYYFASKGYGAISLVYMTLAEGLSLLVFYLCSSQYFPKIRFSFQSLKDMYSFGALLMLSSLVRTTYENILTIIFGKSFGVKDLGYYYQANKFSSAFINAVTLIINKAAFPMIVNSINSGRDSLHEMRQLTRVVCSLTFFFFIMVFSTSDQIIKLLLGSEWIDSGPMLAILSLSGIGMIIEAITRSFLKSFGKAGKIFITEIIKRSFGLAIIIPTIAYGIYWVLYSYVLSTVFSGLLNLLITSKETSYHISHLMYDIMIPLFSAIFFIFLHSKLLFINNIMADIVSAVFVFFIYLFFLLNINFINYPKQLKGFK